MKNIFLLLLTSIFSLTAFTQDLIIKRNGEEIKAKVLEVNISIIKYKKDDNLNGPTFEIKKSDVFIIKYANWSTDIINQVNKPSSENSESHNKTEEISENVDNIKAFTNKHRSITIGYGLSALFGGITSMDREKNRQLLDLYF